MEYGLRLSEEHTKKRKMKNGTEKKRNLVINNKDWQAWSYT